MPAKFAQTVEYCAPCKWHSQSLVRSGNPSLWTMRCHHPAEKENSTDYIGIFKNGRHIDNELRPDWCPIRGDAQAEKEAEE